MEEPVAKLSPAAKAKIKALSGPRPARFMATAALTWLTIAAVIAAAIYSQNPLVSVLAIYLVATRQQVLALLIHEQTHYLGLKSKYGDTIANLITSYPLIVVSIEGYAKIHLAHHRHFFTQDDPDFLRKNGENWTVPMRLWKLARLFLEDVTGISFVKYIVAKFKNPAPADSFRRKHPTPVWVKPVFYLAIAALLTASGGWGNFLLYWMLPLITVFPAMIRWGALCEHTYGAENASVDETTPIITQTWLSRLLLPNLNFSLHAYHHYFPGVSFGNLPAVHRVFAEENLVNQNQLFSGPAAYLRFIVTGNR